MSKIIDETGNKELITKLQELGLHEKEALVYIALLPRQDVGTSVLIKLTGLHGQFVYDALEQLESQGLARHVIQNGRKKFSAAPPQRLLSLIEEKRLAARSIAKELQEKFAGKHEQNFEVYQGDSAFIAHQFDLVDREPEGTTLNAIASESERYQQIMVDYGAQEEFLAKLKKKNIKVRYLGAAQKPSRHQSVEQTGLWQYATLPGNSTGLTNTDIWSNSVTINVFTDPVMCFTITSKEIADGYRAFFETLWTLGKK